MRPTDFRAAPGVALEQINAWVDEQTAGKIPKLLGPGNITSLTRVVISSAIFLDAPWQTLFDEGPVSTFHRLDETQVRTPYMLVEEMLRYAAGDGYQVSRSPTPAAPCRCW